MNFSLSFLRYKFFVVFAFAAFASVAGAQENSVSQNAEKIRSKNSERVSRDSTAALSSAEKSSETGRNFSFLKIEKTENKISKTGNKINKTKDKIEETAESSEIENPEFSKTSSGIPRQTNSYRRPNSKERFKSFVNSTIGPFALLRSAASAGIGTARNAPEEWEGNFEGFARRFASGVGQGAIKQTTIYTLDETLKLDSKFYRSTKRDFGSRFKNALLSTVTAKNEKGKRILGIPRIAGTYAAPVIAREVWFPERFDYKDGLRAGTISLGTGVLFNMFKEFVLK